MFKAINVSESPLLATLQVFPSDLRLAIPALGVVCSVPAGVL